MFEHSLLKIFISHLEKIIKSNKNNVTKRLTYIDVNSRHGEGPAGLPGSVTVELPVVLVPFDQVEPFAASVIVAGEVHWPATHHVGGKVGAEQTQRRHA